MRSKVDKMRSDVGHVRFGVTIILFLQVCVLPLVFRPSTTYVNLRQNIPKPDQGLTGKKERWGVAWWLRHPGQILDTHTVQI